MISVVVPTFAERDNIAPLLTEIVAAMAAGAEWEVIVVDDASPDGTAEVVRRASGSEPRVRLLAREERGLAGAVRAGCEAARGDAVVVMDSDFNHPPSLIPELLARLEAADLVVGSRYVRGGGMAGSRLRYLCSGLYNLWIRAVLGLPSRDNLSGFLAFRRTVLEWLPAERVFIGYGDYCIRLIQAVHRRGGRIVEVPVRYGNRPEGASKTRFVYHFFSYTGTVLELLVRPVEAVRA